MLNKTTKGLILISNVHKALEHEWFCDYINKNEFDLEFILFNSRESELYKFIIQRGFKCKNYTLKSKFYIPFYLLIFYVKLIIRRYDFIHCHLFEASLIGLMSAKLAGIKKRIYTRHHSDFHHVYFPGAVKYDLLINKLSTHIIAVSHIVEKVLMEKENVSANKISVIEHAIDLKMFDKNEINTVRVENLKKKHGISMGVKVIGVVSRFTEWKGVQFIIPAFKMYLESYPDSVLVLANANGEYKEKIMALLHELPGNSYILIEFENDSAAMFQMFDVFIHVPISAEVEAFGQVYIEAMASSVPCIFTKSGIGNRILENKFNCIVVNYSDYKTIFEALILLFVDKQLSHSIVKEALFTVQSNFSIERKNKSIVSIYK
jgi:glycosyltransferase involved in cell wall biosynthesis